MNNRGLFDDFDLGEVNPAYIGLALVGGVIALIVTGQMKTMGAPVKIGIALACTVACYAYLTFTDSG